MKKQKLFVPLLLSLAAAALVVQACGTGQPPEPETRVEEAISAPAALVTATALPTEMAEVAAVEPEAGVTAAEVQPTAAVEEVEIEDTAEPAVVDPSPTPAPTASEPEPAVDVALISEPFTATIGLDSFSAYRMDVSSEFTGTLKGEPTSGDIAGLLEMTKNPEAQHLRVEMNGDTLKSLAPLGVIEIYDIGDTFYLQNPADGSWLGVPAALADAMLPAEMYNPEDSIDLPATAAPHPGTETINGVVVRRYTFGPDDLTGDSASYDEVEGTIWVAVEGNYVVRFEASLSGRHDNLAVNGITLLDEGTISMRYELSDVNGDLSIEPPPGAGGFDLGKLLFQ